ncbi:hypothetical protein FRUB_01582 [Fimbriiglobus ruber]|uniref:Helicase XPB/Ssl2 N-terminal domain-containing protein n=1 Tax=Fimbriiglobus ruber TaxID=1908690 RepID=A0A225DV70_9BACT|nr:hypothetical protein FRUB_01582 [Fimbriiglobus ruber]
MRDALSRYAEPLLREVVGRLVKPRTATPPDELVEKCLSTLANPPVIDRRVAELPPAARKALAVIAVSRRPTWKVGHLITILSALGHPEGFAPIHTLLETGLLCPDFSLHAPAVEQFESWLGSAGTVHAQVFAHPAVAARAQGENLGFPIPPGERLGSASPRFTDGLDWLLRLALVWQQVDEAPVRLTQGRTLFKRDLGRLQTDEVLAAAPPDQLVPVADPGVLSLLWAEASGLIKLNEGELRSAPFPPTWGATLTPAVADLWAALTAVEAWDPLRGYSPVESGLSALPTAGLLALLILAGAARPGQETGWVDPQVIADWLWEHHPSWQGGLPREEAKTRGLAWVEAYLLGVAYPLRLVEAAQYDGWKVRLTDLGRHLLAGGPEPAAAPAFPQTLLVQPNAEVLVYRQGLTPNLIGRLSRFARWKGLGPACTLELNATRTYHGLESGLTLASVLQTLNQHGMKPVPSAVADLLRRWADKRDRITLYSAATLVEFQTAADLDAAVSRGIVSVRVTDRIGLTDDGRDPDFKNLRLIGNRDYEARPQQCVTVDADGVTLTIDAAHSDLMLEAEIGRLADPVTGDPPGLRRVRISPQSLARAQAAGLTLADLDAWFQARAGHPLPAPGRLFVLAPHLAAPTAARHLVVHLPSAEATDGLVQWPTTAALVGPRLGPTAVVVDEANLERLREVLAGLGMQLA